MVQYKSVFRQQIDSSNKAKYINCRQLSTQLFNACNFLPNV